LVGANDSAAEGLSLSVASTVPVADVLLTINKGISQLISERFSLLTDNRSGSIAVLDKTLSSNIQGAEKQISKADLLLEQRRRRYSNQFLLMEKLIQRFKSQGDAMSSFVAALTKSSG
jgi:flagellar capping protein FliD